MTHDPDDTGLPFASPEIANRKAYRVTVRKIRTGGDSFKATGSKLRGKKHYFECTDEVGTTGEVIVITDDPTSIYDKLGVGTVVSIVELGPALLLPEGIL